MKKICVVTGSRAEYGLLRWLLRGIKNSPVFELQLVVTGMHLSDDYGLTINEIEADDFKIDHKFQMLPSSDESIELAKCMGCGLTSFVDVFAKIKPDLLLVLGDRYEIFVAAIASMISCIPIAHVHGGELTQGAIDEAMRHSITKMAHLHFVAASEYRNRVIQLGERPEKVFNVGGLGVDSIKRLDLLTLHELERILNFKFYPRNFLIAYHPETLGSNLNNQLDELFSALDDLKDTGLIFTMPNSDPGGRHISRRIKEYCFSRVHTRAYDSLGQLKFLSCMKYVDGVIGNSSSGLLEAPSLKKATINIGDRQLGRLRADSVIDCNSNKISISKAITQLLSEQFQKKIYSIESPYGNGGASEAIVKILEQESLEGLLIKKFYDIPIVKP